MSEDSPFEASQQDPKPVQEIPVQPTTPTMPSSSAPKRNILVILPAILIAILIILTAVYFLVIKKPKPQPPITEIPRATLVLTQPPDQQATTSAQIGVLGKTNPNSIVVAYTDTVEETFESDGDGNFSGIFTLEEGPNEITFTAFGNQNEEVSETRAVVYIKEEEL